MVSEKFKSYIFEALDKEMSNVSVILYKDSIWFIDRDELYWYLEYTPNQVLWWRFDFFSKFFNFFSLYDYEYEPLIALWVESKLKSPIIDIKNEEREIKPSVMKALKYGVVRTFRYLGDNADAVHEISKL